AVQPEPQLISGPPPAFDTSGIVAFDSATIFAGASQSLIAIPVRRSRSTQGTGAVAWAIEDSTPQPDVDYGAIGSNVIRFFDGQEVRVLYIPLKGKLTAAAAGPRTFTVSLRKVAGGPALGAQSRVIVTIAPVSLSSGL